MRRPRFILAVATALVLLAVPACAGESSPQETTTESSVSVTGAPAAPSAVTSAEPPSEPLKAEDFDPSLFNEDSTTIDNQWLPLRPGTRLVWQGRAFEDGERVDRRVVFTVTGLTKTVAGVRTLVGWDRDFNDDVLGESELIFLAQDRYGNVWHLGQYRETYDEDGEFVGGRVWTVGDPEGATAGILMKADPQPGTPSYSQGFAPPPFNWDDWSRVLRIDAKTTVPVGSYDNILIVEEFEPSKPGASQLKYYAPGVGNVRVGWRGAAEKEREVMVLTRLIELDPEALAEAKGQALELEERAYMYARTEPAQ